MFVRVSVSGVLYASAKLCILIDVYVFEFVRAASDLMFCAEVCISVCLGKVSVYVCICVCMCVSVCVCVCGLSLPVFVWL